MWSVPGSADRPIQSYTAIATLYLIVYYTFAGLLENSAQNKLKKEFASINFMERFN